MSSDIDPSEYCFFKLCFVFGCGCCLSEDEEGRTSTRLEAPEQFPEEVWTISRSLVSSSLIVPVPRKEMIDCIAYY